MTAVFRATFAIIAAAALFTGVRSAPGTAPVERAGAPASAVAPRRAVVLAEDFETARGPIYAALIQNPRLSIAEGSGTGGGRALRATYVGGAMGSARILRNIPLPEAGTEYTLNYDVKFPAGFPFVRGGKMHGLGPSGPVTGGNPIRPDGWSARVMWRKRGRIETYTYHQDQKGQYGESGEVAQQFYFTTGAYHAVSLHVRVNDPVEQANGFVRLYVDGRLVEARRNIRFRAVDDDATRITQFLFSTFHGGNDPSWAPRTPAGRYETVSAFFDNIAIHRGEHVRSRPGA